MFAGCLSVDPFMRILSVDNEFPGEWAVMSKKKSKPSDIQQAIKWAVRVFVLGTLIFLVILAYQDFQAKSEAQRTADAWRDRVQELDRQDGELKQRDLAPLIEGNPIRRDGELADLQNPRTSHRVFIYEWKGVFRTYSIRVGLYDLPETTLDDSIVEVVEGPGPPPPEAE